MITLDTEITTSDPEEAIALIFETAPVFVESVQLVPGGFILRVQDREDLGEDDEDGILGTDLFVTTRGGENSDLRQQTWHDISNNLLWLVNDFYDHKVK